MHCNSLSTGLYMGDTRLCIARPCMVIFTMTNSNISLKLPKLISLTLSVYLSFMQTFINIIMHAEKINLQLNPIILRN